MKAWQFVGTDKPLELNEIPEPTAGPGQVVVDVKASGVGHSDVSTLDDPGWMALFQHGLPRTMGHESAGVVSQVGEGMEHWKVGGPCRAVAHDVRRRRTGAMENGTAGLRPNSWPPMTTWYPFLRKFLSISAPWQPTPD